MLKYLKQLVWFFSLLVCLKRKPQDLPASEFLLVQTVLVYFLVGCAHSTLHQAFFQSILISGLDILFMILFVFLCLKIFRFGRRFSQTLTALAGSGTILTLLAIPVTSGLLRTQDSPVYPLFAFLLLFLFVWSISVQAHIFRHAFSFSLGGGLWFAFLYNLLSYMLISGLLQNQASV